MPAHRFPDNGDGFKHAATEDLALLLWHGGGQRQDQRAQLARRRREAQAQARGDAVDLPQRLCQQLAQHVGHQGAAAVLRREDRQALVLRQREERLAVIVHQVHQRERGGKRFTLGLAVHLAKAPVLHDRGFIPQVATRAGDTAVALGAQTLHRQLAGFITDADNRRPDEGIFATAFHREVLLAKTRFRKLETAGEQRLVQELRLAERANLQLGGLTQPIVRIAVVFNNDAAGVGVTHVEDQVDRNGWRAERMGDKFHFRYGELFTEHGHQVEPVGLILKTAHRLLQVAFRAVLNAVGILGKRLAQPAVNPGLIEETVYLVIAPRQREAGAVQNIVFHRGERGRGMIGNLAVKRERDAVCIACRVRGLKLAHLNARPVIRPFNKGPRRVEAQERNRKPDAIQYRQRLMQRDRGFRLDHFRLAAVHAGQSIATVDQVEIEAQQRAVRGFTYEAPVAGGVLRRQTEIEELHAAVGNKRDALFIVAKIYQHRIRHLLS